MSITQGTLEEAERRYRSLPRLARQASLAGIGPRRAYLDLETTGFDPSVDRILEVGVVIQDGDVTDAEFEALLLPAGPIPPAIRDFTGISEEMIGDSGIEASSAARRLAELLEGAEIVAFNAGFEERFLQALAVLTGVPLPTAGFVDALELARIVLPRLGTHRQADLCELLEIGQGTAHRALADARALARLFPTLLAGVEAMDPGVRGAIAALSPSTEWPLRRVFMPGAIGSRPDLVRWRKAAPRVSRADHLADADDVVTRPLDLGAIRERFAPGGVLEQAGYIHRSGQSAMAESVAQAFNERGHLVVEAGTGTGKSAAYLVPALEFSATNGIRIVVSTHTTALQDQLIDRDIPRLAEALGLPEVHAVVLKGYEHYLCLRRFMRLWDGEELGRTAVAVAAMLTAWVADSAFDELDSLNLHSLGSLDGLVRASHASCLKDRCRFAGEGTCFMWGRRRAARAAHILIVNHALLLADARFAGALYPAARYVVIDEAHELADEARGALTLKLSRQRVAGVLGDLGARGTNLIAARSLLAAGERVVVEERSGDVAAAARLGAEAVRGLFHEVVRLVDERADGSSEARTLRVSEDLRRGSEGFAVVGALAAEALDRISAVIHALRLLEDALASTGGGVDDPGLALAEAAADVSGWRSELDGAAQVLLELVEHPDSDDVAWMTVERRPDRHDEALCLAPLDVGEALARDLFDARDSVVLTSATLSAGDRFRHLVRTVGLDRAEASPRLLEIPSPFDYPRQMAVFVVGDLPEPAQEGYLQALGDMLASLHRATGGGVLTLFTRRSDMKALHDVLAPDLAGDGLTLLCQGRGVGKRRLAEEFRADAAASLLATRSFWQGFDAPGDTLRAVVIARLPFAYWGDPVGEALRERDPRGFWADHYLPRAVLDLKQAAGRLIRSEVDRGVVVLADSRLGSRRYGERFVSALPGGVATFDTSEAVVDAARAFLGRDFEGTRPAGGRDG